MLVKFLKSAPKASKPENEPCGARILAGIPGVDGRLFAQNFANHASISLSLVHLFVSNEGLVVDPRAGSIRPKANACCHLG